MAGVEQFAMASTPSQHATSTAMIAGVDRLAQPFKGELDLSDCRWRQLSTSVWYRSFGKRSKYSAASFFAAWRSLVNFSRMKGSCGIANHVIPSTSAVTGSPTRGASRTRARARTGRTDMGVETVRLGRAAGTAEAGYAGRGYAGRGTGSL
jgi:hypothetical protein